MRIGGGGITDLPHCLPPVPWLKSSRQSGYLFQESLSENELKVLQNEAAHAIGIDHPNVVRVLHFSTGADFSGTPPFLVMELVEGKNLRSVIEAHHSGNSAPSYEELQAMYLQISAGMQAVNEKVIHRDLKPENILIDQASNQLKIADFGLAKLADAATRSETFKGWGTVPVHGPRRTTAQTIPDRSSQSGARGDA